MACSDVKLACCRLCHKPLASNLGECIHCGVCNPIEEKSTPWLHWALLAFLIVGTVLATMRYDGGRAIEQDCRLQEIGQSLGC